MNRISMKFSPRSLLSVLSLMLFSLLGLAAEGQQNKPAEFQALVVSADNSYVASEKNLEYSSMDASRLVRALVTSARVPEQSILVLKNPSIEEFDQAVLKLTQSNSKKFMFYYSGHSDEHGLHLKNGSINKAKFHDLLAKVTSKVKIVVLDSCFSGALKSKGAVKSKPIELVQYNVDEPTGSVILTSSSGTELSYESEKLKGSIFTYHLVSGLYGQADANTDGVVTIDELYQYVYAQTKFQSMVSGGKVQSPEFESRLTGQGALVVAYPARINGQLRLADQVQGELTLAAAKGVNFFKFYKNKGEDKTLSLPRGRYDVTLIDDARVGTGQIEVTEAKVQALNPQTLVWREREKPSVRAKGAEPQFLFGVHLATHPPFNDSEEGAMMGDLFLLSPSREGLGGRWRLGVYAGGQTHSVKGSNQKNEYSRLAIGGEGNYSGLNRWNNDWIFGMRVGTFVSNSNNPTSSSLTHIFFGSRFYPASIKMNWDLLIGIDGVKTGNAEGRSVGTIGFALSY